MMSCNRLMLAGFVCGKTDTCNPCMPRLYGSGRYTPCDAHGKAGQSGLQSPRRAEVFPLPAPLPPLPAPLYAAPHHPEPLRSRSRDQTVGDRQNITGVRLGQSARRISGCAYGTSASALFQKLRRKNGRIVMPWPRSIRSARPPSCQNKIAHELGRVLQHLVA